jgi:hypothetical protein
MTLPPTPMVMEALRETVGPPFAVGVVVLGVARLVFGKSSIPYAALVGFIAAFAVGNVTSQFNSGWWPTSARASWLPWLAIGGAVAGAIARRWALAGAALWATATAMAVVRILAKEFHAAPTWAVPAFVLLPAAIGFGLMKLDAKRPGFAVPLLMGCALMSAGTVAIHAHSKSLLDAATLGGMCLLGFAVVAGFSGLESGSVLPGAAILLTGAAFASYHETFAEIPAAAFALPAAAPLLALVGFVPAVDRLRTRWRVLLVLLPALIAMGVGVGLAMRAEPLRFDDPI